jgi:predicted transcriptional regulator
MRYKEYITDIKTIARTQHWQHILKYRHQYGQMENIMAVMRVTKIGLLKISTYMYKYIKIGLLVDE